MPNRINLPHISQHELSIISKMRTLPPETILEVEDFIDFLRLSSEERRLRRAAAKLSEDSFRKVWDNPEDAEYDRL